jgi:hypothetical protein
MVRYSKLFSRLEYLFFVLKTKGFRYAIAKLVKKTSQRVEEVVRHIEPLPGIPQTDEVNYQKWLNQNYPREADLRKMAETVEILSYKPLISVVMPVFNPPERFLREAIESVLNQVYP